jgi:hypothetical protein
MDFVEQIDNVKSGIDGHLGDRPLPAEGPPLIEADMPDGAGGKLLTGRTCRRCKTSNQPGSEYCNKCGSPLAGCPNCGQAPVEGMAFCTRCGTKMD